MALAKQDDVFGNLGARGKGAGDNSGKGIGTDFDAVTGSGAGLDLSQDFFEFGRHDTRGATQIDAGRTGHEGAFTAEVVPLDGRIPPANDQFNIVSSEDTTSKGTD
jgi:hypothetical protein